MVKYVLQRLVMSLVIIYVVITLSFFMVRLMPGNPMAALEAQLRQQGGLTEIEIQNRIQAIYGLQPTASTGDQYIQFVKNVLQGDLGRPITNPGTTVVAVIVEALPWTLMIVGVSLLISFLVGCALGQYMAARPDTVFTKVMTFVVSFMSAVPNYLVAILFLYLFTGVWHIFPRGGAYSIDVTPGPNVAFLVSAVYYALLPIIATVITSFGGWAMGMKGAAVSVLGSEYVRAAESRGLSDKVITRSYIGRNSMLPMITQLALSVGFMFGGSVFIETYFQYPGIGYYMIQSVTQRDYSLMMGCFLLITITVVITNFLVDLLYPLIDPRIAKPGGAKRREVTESAAPVLPVGGTLA